MPLFINISKFIILYFVFLNEYNIIVLGKLIKQTNFRQGTISNCKFFVKLINYFSFSIGKNYDTLIERNILILI